MSLKLKIILLIVGPIGGEMMGRVPPPNGDRWICRASCSYLENLKYRQFVQSLLPRSFMPRTRQRPVLAPTHVKGR